MTSGCSDLGITMRVPLRPDQSISYSELVTIILVSMKIGWTIRSPLRPSTNDDFPQSWQAFFPYLTHPCWACIKILADLVCTDTSSPCTALSWQELILQRVSGTYLTCASYFCMRSIILAMRGGALAGYFLKAAARGGRILPQQACHEHNNEISPGQKKKQRASPSRYWSNDSVSDSNLPFTFTFTFKGWALSKYCNALGAVMNCLIRSSADWCSGPQMNSCLPC